MRTTNTPRGSRIAGVAGPALRRNTALAITAAPVRWPRPRRLLRGAVVSVAAVSLGVLAVAVPAAHASQRPAAPAAAASPYTFSRIAWTGADEVIAATDKRGDLYYFWQASGTTIWHKQLVARAASRLAYAKPSITAAGTSVYIAAASTAGDLYYFTRTGTAAWHQVLLATAGSPGKYRAPSISANTGGSVLISVGNTGGQLVSFTLTSGDTNWDEQTVAFGLFGPSTATTGAFGLGQITAASGGTLYYWWEGLSGSGWNQQTVAIPGTAGSYIGGTVTDGGTQTVIAAATTTGTVDAFTQPFGRTGWTQQIVSSSGGPYASPQAAWTGPVNGTTDSYDVITAATKTGALDYWWVADGSGLAWNPETVAHGTQAAYARPGIAITSTSVVITAINTKPGNVMYWYQPFDTGPWNKQTVASG